jgi:drug/metabolite transporter superfamily protein YnfA
MATVGSSHSETPVQPMPAAWRNVLLVVAICKAAIAGAGLTLAAMGALDIAFAIAAQHWIHEIQPHYFDLTTAGGGLIGAIWGWIVNR